MYDYVHQFKNIRNLWLTEKTLNFHFEHEKQTFIARFEHLREVFHYENPSLKMSELDKASVYPKPIECNVSVLARKCSKKNQLLCSSSVKKRGLLILNCSSHSECFEVVDNIKRKKKNFEFCNGQPLQAVVSETNDSRLGYLLEFERMRHNMVGKQGNRVKQLSCNTVLVSTTRVADLWSWLAHAS